MTVRTHKYVLEISIASAVSTGFSTIESSHIATVAIRNEMKGLAKAVVFLSTMRRLTVRRGRFHENFLVALFVIAR